MAYMRYTIWIDSEQNEKFMAWIAENHHGRYNPDGMVIDYDWEDEDDV